jgi:hypothetical protein
VRDPVQRGAQRLVDDDRPERVRGEFADMISDEFTELNEAATTIRW